MPNGEQISAEARYLRAWDESRTRAITRDQILSQYLVASFTLLGVALTRRSLLPLALVIPSMSLLVALLVVHHDLIIAALNQHNQELAREAHLAGKECFTSRRGLGTTLWIGALLYIFAVSGAIGSAGIIALYFTKGVQGEMVERLWSYSWSIEYFAIFLVVGARIIRTVREMPRARP